MRLKWITHACFQLESNSGTMIYFDPYQLSGDLKSADVILCSHDHFDHLSEGDINKLATKNTTVVIPETCNLKGDFKVTKLDIGGKADIGEIAIEAVPSYTARKETHPKENRWLGYIVNVDGRRVYHAGDTGKMPEMADFKDIDVACVPVGGTYTMDFDEAAESVKLINPKIVVPMHNWDKDMTPFKEMVEKELPDVKVEILIDRELQL
jgi:L-ascorbate metabolism protein UlaG (beta-lactamase superfamily)